MLLLRDPLQISDRYVAIPVELAPLLALCDGTRDSKGLAAALAVRYGIRVSLSLIQRFITVCDEALLLDNERSHAAQDRLLAEYRAAPFRSPALAGLSYPGDADGLAATFAGYAAGPVLRPPADPGLGGAPAANTWPAGIISPHIDYQRGGPVYAAVWNQAADIVRQADLAVIFGTDHYGGFGELTLTRQNYATPFGILPTPDDMVAALAQGLTLGSAFGHELHHRTEHSIELAATWLHYIRRDLPPLPVLPVLCGSFHHFVAGKGHPDQDRAIGSLIHTIAELTAGRKLLVVAGADLAHVGPAFGQEPQGPVERNRVQDADQDIIADMCAMDAHRFFETVRQVGDRYNVCGLSPIYLALRLLAATRGSSRGTGHEVAYDTCPADDPGTSFVSICGVILR